MQKPGEHCTANSLANDKNVNLHGDKDTSLHPVLWASLAQSYHWMLTLVCVLENKHLFLVAFYVMSEMEMKNRADLRVKNPLPFYTPLSLPLLFG